MAGELRLQKMNQPIGIEDSAAVLVFRKEIESILEMYSVSVEDYHYLHRWLLIHPKPVFLVVVAALCMSK